MASRSSIFAATFAGALLLSGCAPASEDVQGTDEEVVFVHAMASSPAHLNPAITLDSNGLPGFTILESLVSLTGEFGLEPSLAESWAISDDGLSIELQLREADWHDGEPFTSEDVKFTLEEIMGFHPTAGIVASRVLEVETPAPDEAVVKLSEPVAMFLEALTSLPILPQHLYAGTDVTTNETNMAPVGTGPFVFESFAPGDRITVVKNNNYWGETGEIDRIVFAITPDPNARILALESGEVDRISPTDLDHSQVGRMMETTEIQFTTGASAPIAFVLFANITDDVVSDVRVREALYRAIDRETMAELAFFGGVPATGILPEQVAWGYEAQPNMMSMYPFDPEEAGQLFDELGYPADGNGQRFSVTLDFGSGYSTWQLAAELVKTNLEAIGISVELVSSDINVFAEKMYQNNDFQLAVMQFGTVPDPNLGIARQYVCNPNHLPFSNPTTVCDEEIDAAFAEAGLIADREVRSAELARAGERIAELLYTSPLVMFAPPAALSPEWENVEGFERVTSLDYTKLTLRD